MVSGAEIRGFGFLDSWYQVPKFVVSGTEVPEFVSPPKGLSHVVQVVTLLNTESNLPNTQGEAGVSLETLEGG